MHSRQVAQCVIKLPGEFYMSLVTKSSSIAAVLAVAFLGASSAFAVPVVIDGIAFGPGAVLQTTTIWERTVTAPGDKIYGVGLVDSIKSLGCSAHPGSVCWQNGDNGREL